MQLFDPRGKYHERPRSKKDAENARLMAVARERKRLADRTPEQAAEDEARAQRQWEVKILDGLVGEDLHRRETLRMHRRGAFRLTNTQRAYERRKKANHRRRKREQAAADMAKS